MSDGQHIVICGWSDSGRRLLADLLQGEPRPSVVVISPSPPPANTHIRGVTFIHADPATPAGLALVQLDRAEIVVVLADEGRRTPQDADARTILTVLAVEQQRPQIYTIAEILNEENAFHLHNAGVDEVLVSGAYAGVMLSQAIRSPGILSAFGELFRAGNGVQIQQRAPESAQVGQTFQELSRALRAGRQGTLLGLCRAGRALLSPGAHTRLQEGDQLLVLGPTAAGQET